MKFKNLEDLQLFYYELGENDKASSCSLDVLPTSEEVQSFIKKRRGVESLYKDKRKSSKTKSQWREKRYAMMKGIKAYHKSTEGKRFHRNLGRYLATRMTSADEAFSYQKYDFLKALTSAKTHLYVEMEYYHQMFEQVEIEDFVLDNALEMIKSIEEKIIGDQSISVDEFIFLLDLTEEISLVKSLSDKSGVGIEKVEKMWNDIKNSLLDAGRKESDDKFYGLLVHILKKKLNLT